MHVGSKVLSNSKDIAEHFNSLFINAARPNVENVPHDAIEAVRKASPSLDKLREFVTNTYDSTKLFEISLVTNEFVCKQLKSLTMQKAKGIDDIGPYFLKIAAEIISPSLYSILIEMSPNIIWKMAKITPLHKKGKKKV